MRNKGVSAKLQRRESRMEQESSQQMHTVHARASTPVSTSHEGKTLKDRIIRFYAAHYKKFILLPLLLFLLAVGQITYQYHTTGSFFYKDVSISGGTSLTVHRATADVGSLQSTLDTTFGKGTISVRSLHSAGEQIGVIIDASPDVDDKQLLSAVGAALGTLSPDEYSVEITGSSLGSSFFSQLFKSLVLAFVFMAIVVLIYFRSIGPSIAVILAALFDIVETIAVLNLLGVKLSGAGIAALLMIIGYSVDTEMLLSSRVHNRKGGSVYESIYSALKPGLLMSFTVIVAVTIALIFTQSDVLRQIMIITLLGLLFDLVNTWLQNTGILTYLEERKGGHQ